MGTPGLDEVSLPVSLLSFPLFPFNPFPSIDSLSIISISLRPFLSHLVLFSSPCYSLFPFPYSLLSSLHPITSFPFSFTPPYIFFPFASPYNLCSFLSSSQAITSLTILSFLVCHASPACLAFSPALGLSLTQALVLHVSIYLLYFMPIKFIKPIKRS